MSKISVTFLSTAVHYVNEYTTALYFLREPGDHEQRPEPTFRGLYHDFNSDADSEHLDSSDGIYADQLH